MKYAIYCIHKTGKKTRVCTKYSMDMARRYVKDNAWIGKLEIIGEGEE